MLNLKWTLSAVMLAGAFAGTASMATAQSQHYRGSFELPFEARFGNVVLQPGNYTVSTLEGAKGIRITGDKGNVTLLSNGYDLKPEGKDARLTLVDSGGMYALRTFESDAMGKVLRFHIEKTPRGAVERASAKPTIEVGLQ